MKSMSLGIVGLGRAGDIHHQALRSSGSSRLISICDPSAEARQRASASGLTAYADLQQMLDREKLTAVIVCTPPSDHSATTMKCLENGLHVLCEKPLGLTTADVLRMLQTANREKHLVRVASKFRHVPQVIQAREMLLGGELGEPVSFEINFCSPVDMAERWNCDRVHSGGGVIIDNGCHALDITSFLFGNLHRIHATRLKSIQHLPVEDSATLQIWAGEAGVIGKIDLSWSLSSPSDSYLTIHGSRGTLEVGWQSARIKQSGKPWRTIGEAYDKIEAHSTMHRHFAGSIENGHKPWITETECLQVVAAVDAAYRSLESGSTEWVSIQGAHELSLVSQATAPWSDEPAEAS